MLKEKKEGFALIEVVIVVAIIGLIAAVAIPGFKKVRVRAQEEAIRKNLELLVDGGKQCILENGLKEPVFINELEGSYCPKLRSIAGECYKSLAIDPSGGILVVSLEEKVIQLAY